MKTTYTSYGTLKCRSVIIDERNIKSFSPLVLVQIKNVILTAAIGV